jgi:hypothetical protein
MGVYINPVGKQYVLKKSSQIFVDHSMLIEYTNSLFETDNRYVCVSRPRRFGKSTDANMLVAYYSKGCKSDKLFDDLKISKMSTYQEHLNQHNVIKIDMQKILARTKNINDFIKYLSDEIIEELLEIYDINTPRMKSLPGVLEKIYSKTSDEFIFVVDEWDSVIRAYSKDKESQKKYLQFLSDLFKDQNYIEFVYMTGILPIRKYGNESVLNMFKEITFINSYPLEQFMGFTEDEVKKLCEQYDMSFESMKEWYNGYTIGDNLSVYNPRSVVFALTDKKYGNYWTGTQTYEMLKGYLNVEPELKPDVLDLLNDKEVKVDVTPFQNDITTFTSKDDVLTLLIHLGYLGYNSKNKTVYIPNKEIKDEFVLTIKNAGWGFITKLAQQSETLLEATIQQDEEKVAEILDNVHNNVESKQYNNEYHLSAIINIAYIMAREYYTIIHELPSGKGYADIGYIPARGVNKPAMIVELKSNKSDAPNAIEQIIEKKYNTRFNHYLDNLLYVGISYDENKAHSCKIIKYDPNASKN